MKKDVTMQTVEISKLWDNTGNLILQYDEFNSPASLAELRKCDNVIIDGEMVLVDNTLGFVDFCSVRHPADDAKIYVCRFNPL